MDNPRAEDSPPAVPTRTASPLALVTLLRPTQWVKNAFVLAPSLFAREAHNLGPALTAVAAAGLFCLASSAVYCANDVADRERDRLHPRKRLRPVASGQVSPAVALLLAAVLAVAAVGGGLALSRELGWVLAAYIGLNALYSLWLKQVVLLDVILVASFFVLRVVGGAVAIQVPASHWILICTFLVALFLALGKRRAELATLSGTADAHRPALVGYTPDLLLRFDGITLGATLISYALYTVAPETVAKFGSDRLVYGLPFVVYGLFRYLLLIESGRDAGEPDRLLLRDRPLILCILLWVAFNATVIYSG